MQAQLNELGHGFADPALCSQSVFRHALDALSLPGRIAVLDASGPLKNMQTPRGAHPAAAALLLALLDQDCKLWLSGGFSHSDAAAWLRFHTGCSIVQDPAQADFAWVAQAAELPLLARFSQGSAEYPDLSATCVIQVDSLQAQGSGWTLSGPGIEGSTQLHVGGLSPDFCSQRRAEQAHFPCGLDFLFTHGLSLVGLPRTTQLES
ncbi:MAG: phosphonate C-P lyase system protein PhnH [Rhodoferax sp.]|jgi:alpha-D-ribose 1-methylphosphonate 5-triphosphate synthase subunit PhnH|nr:phosphonate C-P lyase system protein PhnH [Rhodoferax sp.]MBJ7467414.1 phosphonate C-P lyase system protein PhnH [Rhodoferax sp.]